MAEINQKKLCHLCGKSLSRVWEELFVHCFECGLKRLEVLTANFDPCPICEKNIKTITVAVSKSQERIQ